MNIRNRFKSSMGLWQLTLVVLAVLSLVSIGAGETDKKADPKPGRVASAPAGSQEIDQTEVGLRKEKLLGETGEVVTVKKVGQKPGKGNERYDAPYATPPMIPHQVEDYLPIKAGSNDCLSCHVKPSKKWKKIGVPLLGDFHRTDREGNLVKNRKGIYMGFYNCSTCHNVITDAKPLVENTF
ncbi:MAG: hypothetical protein CSA81_05150 [Acidobacteria bacterium]|nr:MAG: hypothetical protein CSA81_05150 [Acidobacteriota bacterium]PIE91024.1 MAG: hypothetical protein CR997_02585 [Acidobacteriota bacterium]